MTSGFTKLFNSILASTVWQEPDTTRIVWITLLSMADAQGFVSASVPGLAHTARVPLAETKRALETFLAPDRYSRTLAFEGRRIVEVDGGWRLLNYEKYRAARDTGKRREDNAHYKRVERERNKQSASVSSSQQPSASVSDVSHGQPQSAQAEAEAEAENTSLFSIGVDARVDSPGDILPQSSDALAIEPTKPLELAPQARRKSKVSFKEEWLDEIYLAYPKHVNPDAAKRAIEKALRGLVANGHEGEQYDPQEAYEAILRATQRYASSASVKRKRDAGEMNFISAPAMWFNKGGHKSDPGEWA